MPNLIHNEVKSTLKSESKELLSLSSESMLQDLRKFKWSSITDEVNKEAAMFTSVLTDNMIICN